MATGKGVGKVKVRGGRPEKVRVWSSENGLAEADSGGERMGEERERFNDGLGVGSGEEKMFEAA